MTLLWAVVVFCALCASAICEGPSSDVTGAPVMALRGKRFIPYNKCPWGTMTTLWGCMPTSRAYRHRQSPIFDMPHMNSPRITRTRGVFRQRVRPF